MLDPRSPIHDWDPDKKRAEALRYSELEEKDITSVDVMRAYEVYDQLVLNCSRALKTYRAALKSLDAIDKYMEEVDFDKVDKKGEMVNDPKKFQDIIRALKPTYESLKVFHEAVMKDLKEQGKIRGNRQLGYNEGRDRPKQTFTESNTQLPDEPVVDTDTGEVLEDVKLVDNSAGAQSMKGKFAKINDLIPKS